MRSLIEILGPTGVGKSRIAIELAREYSGEVISADSMQVYKGFDVGTDKITPEAMSGIPHFGIDIYDAEEQYNAFRFLDNSWNWCLDIWSRERLPVLCGGTALYLRVIQQGVFEEVRGDAHLRDKLKARLEREGKEAIWDELFRIDPDYAEKIGRNDEKRVIRGLEIFHNTGLSPSEAFLKNRTPFRDTRIIKIGLNMERKALYHRIEERVDRMIASGLVAETISLRKRFSRTCPPFSGVGYREICDYLEGGISLEEAVALIKQHSRNYAKRQLSWWRQESDINWFEPGQIDEIKRHIEREMT